jgi:UPF0755 protein
LKFFLRSLLILIFTALFAAGGSYLWFTRPLAMPEGAVELRVSPGSGLRHVAQSLNQAGVGIQPDLLALAARLQGREHAIRAGVYSVAPGTTPQTLLELLVSGKVLQAEVRLIEGWTFRQWRAQLARHPDLEHVTTALSEAELMARLGWPGQSPEGMFLPDTYRVDKYSTDLELLSRAARAMSEHLAREWRDREADLPYKNAYEALVMASIVEKETGVEADRAQVAGVFINRLRLGMRLQTDPTVIYGLGERFDGNLRKVDLQTDTPYNTYTRDGLPPTPIAMPGRASLHAALHPARTPALYFVARGDGSSHFSITLNEHNQAVDRYQRRGHSARNPS